jgi:hypothetical protein
MVEEENAYRLLVEKHEGVRPLGVRRRLRILGGMDGLILTRDSDQWRALPNTIMNLRIS